MKPRSASALTRVNELVDLVETGEVVPRLGRGWRQGRDRWAARPPRRYRRGERIRRACRRHDFLCSSTHIVSRGVVFPNPFAKRGVDTRLPAAPTSSKVIDHVPRETDGGGQLSGW